MKDFNYKLTLEFKLSTSGEPIDPDVAVMLNHILSDWNDGRNPFSSEMIAAGLRQCLKDAVYHTCQKKAQEKYGNEMVVSDNGEIARFAIEADKAFEVLIKSLAFPQLYIEPKARIERTQ
jgi:hypothetical protein